MYASKYKLLLMVQSACKSGVQQLDDLLFQADQMFTQKNGKVCIENNKLSISRLEAEELPERIVKLQQLITKLLPKVELSDLLIEVDKLDKF